jgi:hypothetical protein
MPAPKTVASSMRSGSALALACVAAVLARLTEAGVSTACLLAASAALCLYIAIELPRTAGFGRVLACAAVAAAALVLALHETPWPILRRALAVGTLLAAFVTAMNLLRETAQTSALIKRCGQHILRQPPRWRYGALSLSGNLFGILAAFGVINLFGVMIRRANTLTAAGGDEALRQRRERRSMLAILRGFGHTAQWSPVAIPFAVVSSGYPEVAWLDILPLGLATALLLISLGWLMDAATVPRATAAAPPGDGRSIRWTVHLRLAALILLLFCLLLAADAAIGRSFIVAAVIVMPGFALCWIAVQYTRFGRRRALAATARRARRIVLANFADQRLETTIIACASFVGALIAGVVDTDTIAAGVEALQLSPLAIAIAAVWLIVILGHVGLTPVLVVAVLVAVIDRPEAFGIPVVAFAIAVLGAWGLTQQSSPFNIPVLLAARLVGRSPQLVGQRWNGAYTLAGALLHSAWVYAIFLLWPG